MNPLKHACACANEELIMDTNKQYSSVASAARDFFGPRPGFQGTAMEWMTEWKELSDDSKAEIGRGLVQNGYKITGL